MGVAEDVPAPGVEHRPGHRLEHRVDLDVLAVGEMLVALEGEPGALADSPTLRKRVGGAEGNVCIGLSRLGRRAALVTRVGDDPLGVEVVRTLRGEGVLTDAVRVGGGPTGLMLKEHRRPGRTDVYYHRRGSAATTLTPEDLPTTPARHAHTTGITLVIGPGPAQTALELLRRTRAAGGTTSFDPNHRARLCSWEEAVAAWRPLLPHVTDLLCSEEEARALSGFQDLGDGLDALLAAGPDRVVVRRGAAGAVAATAGTRHEVAAVPVPVVDTVGAGDAFTAGYLHEVLGGRPLNEALRTGAWVAACVVAAPGDYQGLPTRRDLERWRRGEDEDDR